MNEESLNNRANLIEDARKLRIELIQVINEVDRQTDEPVYSDMVQLAPLYTGLLIDYDRLRKVMKGKISLRDVEVDEDPMTATGATSKFILKIEEGMAQIAARCGEIGIDPDDMQAVKEVYTQMRAASEIDDLLT